MSTTNPNPGMSPEEARRVLKAREERLKREELAADVATEAAARERVAGERQARLHRATSKVASHADAAKVIGAALGELGKLDQNQAHTLNMSTRDSHGLALSVEDRLDSIRRWHQTRADEAQVELDAAKEAIAKAAAAEAAPA